MKDIVDGGQMQGMEEKTWSDLVDDLQESYNRDVSQLEQEHRIVRDELKSDQLRDAARNEMIQMKQLELNMELTKKNMELIKTMPILLEGYSEAVRINSGNLKISKATDDKVSALTEKTDEVVQ